MTILALIQNAIDVPMMDVKNISDMIYQYIEYDEYQGPEYDINLEIVDGIDMVSLRYNGERIDRLGRLKIFIMDGKLVPTITLRDEKRTAEDGGLTINGKNYCRVEMADTFGVWFHAITNQMLQEDRRKKNTGICFNCYYNMPNQKHYNKLTWKFINKDSLKEMVKNKKSLSVSQSQTLLREAFIQPLIELYKQISIITSALLLKNN